MELAKVHEVYEDVLKYGRELPEPPNESSTCEWIILPLMLAVGYAPHELHSQTKDQTGKIPDYTVLPDTPHTWYIEAKNWSTELKATHVDQAMNYAHSSGQRWVVLTNGREWQLYDDHITGRPQDRLVVTAKLTEGERFESLLQALSKESVQNGGLERFASRARLSFVLAEQLADPESQVVKAIRATLKKNAPFIDVQAQDIVDCLAQQLSSGKVICTEPENPILPKPQVSYPQGEEKTAPSVPVQPQERLYLLTPVTNHGMKTAGDVIRGLLEQGWYVIGDKTPHRARLKEGDCIAFYWSGKGIVACAEVASRPERGTVPGLSQPEKWPWRFRVRSVRYFFDSPIAIPEVRSQLDAFKGNEHRADWGWFVQITHRLSEKDYRILTRATPRLGIP